MTSVFGHFPRLTEAEQFKLLSEHVPEIPKDAKAVYRSYANREQLIKDLLDDVVEVGVLSMFTRQYDNWQRGHSRLFQCQQRFQCTEIVTGNRVTLVVDTRSV